MLKIYKKYIIRISVAHLISCISFFSIIQATNNDIITPYKLSAINQQIFNLSRKYKQLVPQAPIIPPPRPTSPLPLEGPTEELMESFRQISSEDVREIIPETEKAIEEFIPAEQKSEEILEEIIAQFEPTSEYYNELISNLSKNLQNLLQKSSLFRLKPLLVLQGALTNYALMHDNKDIINKLKASYKNAVRSLIWFYFTLAIDKSQPFEEGTFVIENPSLSILDFLKIGGKPRHSSHFKDYARYTGTIDKLQHYGLDIEPLPEGKLTLLFGEVNPTTLFIKPENYGVQTWYDTAMHTWEFIVAQVRKSPLGKYVVEKRDDDPSYRKERIPGDILNNYISILDNLVQRNKITLEEKSEYKQEAKALGIQAMFIRAQELQDQIRQPEEDEIKQHLKELLADITQYDNLNIRIGREVILKEKELKDIVTPQDAKTIAQELGLTE